MQGKGKMAGLMAAAALTALAACSGGGGDSSGSDSVTSGVSGNFVAGFSPWACRSPTVIPRWGSTG
jgi:ABC-type glycerol-3-phosphate transport system substrate-binding protein